MLAHEHDSRGDAIRALVLCDAELAAQRPDDALTGVLDPAAGTARHAVLALAADDRIAHLRPLLVSGRGLRCHPNDAEVLLAALEPAAGDRFKLDEWDAEPDGLLVTLRSGGAEWMPRAWVELATRAARGRDDAAAGRHPRAARRGLELPAAERAGRHDDRHHRRVRPADARPLAAAGLATTR